MSQIDLLDTGNAPSHDVAKWGLDREGPNDTCRVCGAGPGIWCDRVAHDQARIRRMQDVIEGDGLGGGYRPPAATIAANLAESDKLDDAGRDRLIGIGREMDRQAARDAQAAAAAPYVAIGAQVESRAQRRAAAREAARIERAEQQRDRDASAAIAREQPRARPAHAVDSKVVGEYLAWLVPLVGRELTLERVDKDRAPAVAQRCRACRRDIVGRLPDRALQSPDWQAQVGRIVRHWYAIHICEPVTAALSGMTDAEAQELLETTEAEADRAMTRAGEIVRELRRRADERTKG